MRSTKRLWRVVRDKALRQLRAINGGCAGLCARRGQDFQALLFRRALDLLAKTILVPLLVAAFIEGEVSTLARLADGSSRLGKTGGPLGDFMCV